MSAVAGVVLAGGRSTRMGRPKASLEWHGSTLLHRVTGIVARAVDGPVVVVRAPDQELPDAAAAACASSRTPPRDAARFRASPPGSPPWPTRPRWPTSPRPTCPSSTPRSSRAVLRAAKQEDVDVALPVVHGFRHPLAAAYRTSLLPAVEELIAEDRMRPAFLFERSRVRELTEDDLLRDRELAEADPELLSVLNVNEPDDYERARARAAPSVTVRRFGTLATTSAASRSPSAPRRSRPPQARRASRSTATSWPR